MKSTEGKIGRVFMLRLEDGDIVPDCIEKFTAENSIKCGHVILVGGIGGGQVVTGPRKTDEMPPDPLFLPVDDYTDIVSPISAKGRTRCLRKSKSTIRTRQSPSDGCHDQVATQVR